MDILKLVSSQNEDFPFPLKKEAPPTISRAWRPSLRLSLGRQLARVPATPYCLGTTWVWVMNRVHRRLINVRATGTLSTDVSNTFEQIQQQEVNSSTPSFRGDPGTCQPQVGPT